MWRNQAGSSVRDRSNVRVRPTSSRVRPPIVCKTQATKLASGYASPTITALTRNLVLSDRTVDKAWNPRDPTLLAASPEKAICCDSHKYIQIKDRDERPAIVTQF